MTIMVKSKRVHSLMARRLSPSAGDGLSGDPIGPPGRSVPVPYRSA